MSNKVSYSVVNTHKSMLINTLPYFGVLWVKEPLLLPKLMKGYFNLNPSRPKVRTSWDVSKVLCFLRNLMPVHEISLRLLTFKLIALIALTTASRAQTLLALDLRYMSVFADKVIFQIQKLLKTCKPGTPVHRVVLHKFSDNRLCVVSTLHEYLKRTKNNRKSSTLFVSYKTFNPVSTCTLARWLKNVLELSGIRNFTAHSFRGTSASVAYSSGVSIKEIMDAANWSSSKTFFKFYYKEVNIAGCDTDGNFVNTVLNR